MSAAVDRVLGALRQRGIEAKPSGAGKWQAKCPCHKDQNPSLSIGEGEGGKALLKCFGGCPTLDIVNALNLRMSDLFDTPARPEKQWYHTHATIPKTAAPEAPRSTKEAGARESHKAPKLSMAFARPGGLTRPFW
jgi:hypothetical protein